MKGETLLKISADLYASIDSGSLLRLINDKPELKSFIDEEFEKAKRTGSCASCSGGCHGCNGCSRIDDKAYLTTALISIFEYYMPEDIKSSIQMGGSSYIES